jgi:hypothetical protein
MPRCPYSQEWLLSTFALSAVKHEYSLIAHNYWHAAGPMTAFFMLQPLLFVVHPFFSAVLKQAAQHWDAWARPRSGSDSRSSQFLAEYISTVILMILSGLLFWFPAYEPPYSDMTHDMAQAMLRIIGLCEFMPHCRAINTR